MCLEFKTFCRFFLIAKIKSLAQFSKPHTQGTEQTAVTHNYEHKVRITLFAEQNTQ